MSAVISPCGLYRFSLRRAVGMVGPVVAFFGINPSEAGPVLNDASVRKMIGFAKKWGCSQLLVGNASPFRAKDVRALASQTKWLDIERENLIHIQQIIEEADRLVPCWGAREKVPRWMHGDLDQLLAMLLASGKPVEALGLTVGGDPKHPLRLAYSTPLVPLLSSSG